MPTAIDIVDEQTAAPRRTRRALVAATAVIGVLAIAYAVSPAIGAFRLLQAARDGDVAGVEARVSFPRLRRSVARQLVSEAVRARQLQGVERQIAQAAGTAAVSVGLDELLTARTIADLLGGRAIAPSAGGAPAVDLSVLRIAPVGTALDVWWRSGFTGLASYEIALDRPGAEGGLRAGLELRGLTWRLTSLTLPQDLREELARRLVGAARQPQP